MAALPPKARGGGASLLFQASGGAFVLSCIIRASSVASRLAGLPLPQPPISFHFPLVRTLR